jgi:hypothetical protein
MTKPVVLLFHRPWYWKNLNVPLNLPAPVARKAAGLFHSLSILLEKPLKRHGRPG